MTMKKLLIAGFAFLSFTTAVNAQFVSHNFKPFRVDVMLGYAIPSGPGAKGGVAVSLEPKYSIIDKVSVGLRMEAAITARGYVKSDGSAVSADVKASGSYLFTGDYYYTNKFFRPFSGVGTGIFSLASASVSATAQNGTASASGGTKFGGMVRSGFDLGHFRFVAEYNLIGKSTQIVTDDQGVPTGTAQIKNSYASIKLGFFFGGGRKAKTVNAKF